MIQRAAHSTLHRISELHCICLCCHVFLFYVCIVSSLVTLLVVSLNVSLPVSPVFYISLIALDIYLYLGFCLVCLVFVAVECLYVHVCYAHGFPVFKYLCSESHVLFSYILFHKCSLQLHLSIHDSSPDNQLFRSIN